MGTDRRPASPGNIRLMLLGSPPDMVHGVPPRRPARSHIPPYPLPPTFLKESRQRTFTSRRRSLCSLPWRKLSHRRPRFLSCDLCWLSWRKAGKALYFAEALALLTPVEEVVTPASAFFYFMGPGTGDCSVAGSEYYTCFWLKKQEEIVIIGNSAGRRQGLGKDGGSLWSFGRERWRIGNR